MIGNLWERTHDWFRDYDTKPSTNPLEPDGGSGRVERGGEFSFNAGACRSSARNRHNPTVRGGDFGFRLALSPSGGPPEAGKSK